MHKSMTKSQISDHSKVSSNSQKILASVTQKSSTKLYRFKGIFDSEDIRVSWNAFGLYLSRQLRMGRAVHIQNFGTFTFSAPDYKLEGCSNPWERDKQLRNPVFLVSKDFIKGGDLKQGICTQNIVRPYGANGVNGKIPLSKINFTEVGIYASMEKDQAKTCIERIIRQLQDQAKAESSVDMEIPNVGFFRVRNNIVAVQFNEFLSKDAKQISNQYQQLTQKKLKGEMSLTRENLKRFLDLKSMEENLQNQPDDILEIDEKTQNFIKQNYNIDLQSLNNPTRRSIFDANRTKSANPQSIMSKTAPYRDNWISLSGKQSKEYIHKNRKEIDYSLKQLTIWINKNQLTCEDAFIEFCKKSTGNHHIGIKLTSEDIYNGISKLNLEINSVQITELHRLLDHNKDGFVDLDDWLNVFRITRNPQLQLIRENIRKSGFSEEDLLEILGFTKDQKSINNVMLKGALKKLDKNLDDAKAFQIVQSIMKEKELIDSYDIIEELGVNQKNLMYEEAGYIDKKWLLEFVQRLGGFQNVFRQKFQDLDPQNQGVLDVQSFKSCFQKDSMDVTGNEIHRLVKNLQVLYDMGGQSVRYVDFMYLLLNVKVEDVKNEEKFINVEDFVKKIKDFLDKNGLSNPQVIIEKVTKKIGQNEIKVEDFATFLQKYAFQYNKESELMSFIQLMDIDNDGIISFEDLDTFLSRLEYINNNNVRKVKQKEIFQENKLYPQKPLSEKEMEDILRELRQILYLKKMSFYNFFKLLDGNKDDFITINDFQNNIGLVIKLNKEDRDGLFAFMDKQKIGMIDYKTFIDTMNLTTLDLQQQQEQREFNLKAMKKEDDWEWTKDVLAKIKNWFREERLTIQDAFRVFDKDFDGYISKEDLQNFLKDVLKISEKELEGQRINRLFKLMDEFKRGTIKLADLNRLLCEDFSPVQNFVVTGGKFIEGRSSLDWKINAKQQIGLVISRQFLTLDQSFDSISGGGQRIIYNQFEQWIEKSRALLGFNLTNQLIQQVFSDLDPHKKGYLTKKDWISTFSIIIYFIIYIYFFLGGFNWQNQMLKEVQETVSTDFRTLEEAFNYFSNKSVIFIIHFIYIQLFFQKYITYSLFENAIKSLFPDRFHQSDIMSLWFKLVNNNTKLIDYQNFLYIFGDKRSALLQQEHPRPLTAPLIMPPTNNKYAIYDPTTDEIVTKVKQILRTSNKSINQVFNDFDKDKSGEISNLEFKAAFRNLIIGLTSKEIDVLLNFCDESGEGIVNWREFINKFKKNESQEKIIERSKQRLKLINDDIHYYMLSPKDAFRHFNTDHTGFMKFDEYVNFMQKLSQYGNYPLPPYEILRDIFDTIDIRKDNLIDMNEWLQTFNQFKPPDASMQGRPLQLNANEIKESKQMKKMQTLQQRSQMPFDIQNQRLDLLKIHNPNNINKVMDFKEPLKQLETSKEYDDIMHIIGRNRKYLINIFQEISKRQQITYEVAKNIIAELLRSIGIVIDNQCYIKLLKFAEKNGIIDYQFLLEVYKERMSRIVKQPLKAFNKQS
ncbi:hypothetical protein IMG5_070330 [Ichthyophthirius multifiliis]|uniref:EF-hand domain-containing protein n=1 Tax=Ichthyophthirius multifiliis TaxID=5932 RepID=G0QPQ5_ICHMU|nr:hypothetical protein IMG5_070330 [Ichthyophthirius multifiliis]EGR32802.1 hypothetical protein IMG5_070330 [Ichthyophthirius multifiliis]|eukprot:XP_004036788.1 hypothetical protein IMG5_070330 [Ichthyophthirius multifiliis]